MWRLQGSLQGKDLRSIDSSSVSLAEQDLSGCNLSQLNLEEKDLSRCNLSGAILAGARLKGALLKDTELEGADFTGADLSGADLRRSNGTRLKGKKLLLVGALLSGAEWREADLEEADLSDIQGQEFRLDRANLRGANLQQAQLNRAVLDDTILTGARLDRAIASRATFYRARGLFSSVDANLQGADLRGVLADSLAGAWYRPPMPLKTRFKPMLELAGQSWHILQRGLRWVQDFLEDTERSEQSPEAPVERVVKQEAIQTQKPVQKPVMPAVSETPPDFKLSRKEVSETPPDFKLSRKEVLEAAQQQDTALLQSQLWKEALARRSVQEPHAGLNALLARWSWRYQQQPAADLEQILEARQLRQTRADRTRTAAMAIALPSAPLEQPLPEQPPAPARLVPREALPELSYQKELDRLTSQDAELRLSLRRIQTSNANPDLLDRLYRRMVLKWNARDFSQVDLQRALSREKREREQRLLQEKAEAAARETQAAEVAARQAALEEEVRREAQQLRLLALEPLKDDTPPPIPENLRPLETRPDLSPLSASAEQDLEARLQQRERLRQAQEKERQQQWSARQAEIKTKRTEEAAQKQAAAREAAHNAREARKRFAKQTRIRLGAQWLYTRNILQNGFYQLKAALQPGAPSPAELLPGETLPDEALSDTGLLGDEQDLAARLAIRQQRHRLRNRVMVKLAQDPWSEPQEARLSFRSFLVQAAFTPPFETRLQVRGPAYTERQKARILLPLTQLSNTTTARLRSLLRTRSPDLPQTADLLDRQTEVADRNHLLFQQALQLDLQARSRNRQRHQAKHRQLQDLQQRPPQELPPQELRLAIRTRRFEQQEATRLTEIANVQLRQRQSQQARIRELVAQTAHTIPTLARRLRSRIAPPPLPPLIPGADLSGLRLEGARLNGLDLTGARLTGAFLMGADLSNTCLKGANLTDADLSEARLSNTDFTDAILSNARLTAARGLSPAQLKALLERSGRLVEEDDRSVRISAMASAGAIAAGLAVYLVLEWTDDSALDPGSLEHAAGEAQRVGQPSEASATFEKLAEKQELPDLRANYLLEAAAAAEEAEDYARALELVQSALEIAKDGPMELTVRLRLARALNRASMNVAAEAEYRSLLSRIDLQPTQAAEALVGLWQVLPEGSSVVELQQQLLSSAATDLERGGLALALADSWSAVNRSAFAHAILEQALPLIQDHNEQDAIRLRLGRVMVDEGNTDGALAIYQELFGSRNTIAMEARLGSAELLFRGGAFEKIESVLGPVQKDSDPNYQARAAIILANIALSKGDNATAVSLLEEALKLPELDAIRTDETRLMLGRILIKSDPVAAAALADQNPMLKEELILGQARALREAGDRAQARALWVQLSEDPATGEDARTEAQLSLADLQLEEGDPDGALRRFEQLLERTTTASLRQRIVLGMADALLKAGKLQEAESRYEGLIPVSSEEVAMRCRLGLARAAELRGQGEKATRQYLEVAQTDGPWATEALLSLAELRERSGDLSGAAEVLRLARTRPGAEAERKTAATIALARVLTSLDDSEATELYATLLEAPDPEVRVQARLTVGSQALENDPVRAKVLFDEALAEVNNPDLRAEARSGWIRATIATTEDPTEAIEKAKAWLAAENDDLRRGALAVAVVHALLVEGALAQAIEIGEKYRQDGGFELEMELSACYRELGDFSKALDALERATAGTLEDQLWREEALLDLQLQAGRWSAAEATCTRLAGLPGGDAPSVLGKARIRREQGRLQEALSLLESLDDPRALPEKALIYHGLGQLDRADAIYKQMMLSSDPEIRSAGRVGLARMLLENGEPERALAALDADPVEPGYQLTADQIRGESLLVLGRMEEAEALYSGLGGDAEARTIAALGLGECALAGGNAQSAKIAFEEALQSTDRYYQAQAIAGLLRAAQEAGDLTEAGRLLNQLRTEYADQPELISFAESSLSP
jgi:uncharacterized protein YjbI with pentapeptide repeats/predicted negative regulator of RcsB-dependent stress response